MKLCPKCSACFEDGFDLCAYDGGALESGIGGGRVLAGRYRLDALLKGGGMGVVYRATHLQIGSTVAVKLIRPKRSAQRIAVARFQREAQVLGQIKHPNAVLVMDFGFERRPQTELPYLVMEYLKGESLHQRLKKKRRLSLAEVERILSPLCEAVTEANRVGVVHRDIKPSNIFLERLGDGSEIVKVLDFGIAKFIAPDSEITTAEVALGELSGEDTRSDRTAPDTLEDLRAVEATIPDSLEPEDASTQPEELTAPGLVIGTPGYMAPEQLLGLSATVGSDVYAIGALVFRMLAGALPHEDGHRALTDFGVHVPAAVQAVLTAALSWDPAVRPSPLELSRTIRDAALMGAPAVRDPVFALGVQLGAVTATIDRVAKRALVWPAQVKDQSSYEAARDLMLKVDGLLLKLTKLLEACGETIDEGDVLIKEIEDFDEALLALSEAFLSMEGEGDYLRYIGVLGARQCATARSISRLVRRKLDIEEDERFGLDAGQAGGARLVLDELSLRLVSESALVRADALVEALGPHLPIVKRALSPRASGLHLRASALIEGLWAHADALVLRELFRSERRPGLLGLLSNTKEERAFFGLLARLFAGPAGQNAAALVTPCPRAAQQMLWRCLLVHPQAELRQRALQSVPLDALWTSVAYPNTPLGYKYELFAHAAQHAPPEYLRVFVLCVMDNLRTPHESELVAAYLFLNRCFGIANFREELFFEPLLEVDRSLSARVVQLGIEAPQPEGYAQRLTEFINRGADRGAAAGNLSEIPLPVHREVARKGHFIAFYVSHAVDAIARQTLPFLLRMEDVTQYLRIPTINRSVLLTLARKRRYFKKESARVALVHNPKTPVQTARRYLPYFSAEQLRQLAADRTVGADLRQLAASFLQRLEQSKK